GPELYFGQTYPLLLIWVCAIVPVGICRVKGIVSRDLLCDTICRLTRKELNMALRTVEQYKESLRDGRLVYFRGHRVEDVTEHPVIRVAVNHAAIDYEIAHQPEHRALAVYRDPGSGQEYSRYFKIPSASEDLLKRSELIETSTRIGRTLVVLVKEIGTDCLLALHLVAKQMDEKLGTKYLPRVRAIYEHCRDNDLAMAVAQTDVKGD